MEVYKVFFESNESITIRAKDGVVTEDVQGRFFIPCGSKIKKIKDGIELKHTTEKGFKTEVSFTGVITTCNNINIILLS